MTFSGESATQAHKHKEANALGRIAGCFDLHLNEQFSVDCTISVTNHILVHSAVTADEAKGVSNASGRNDGCVMHRHWTRGGCNARCN